MSVEKMDHRGHYRFHNRDVDGGSKRSSKSIQIAIARGEPVKDICTSEHRLYCFEYEYSAHYIRVVRSLKR